MFYKSSAIKMLQVKFLLQSLQNFLCSLTAMTAELVPRAMSFLPPQV